MTETTETATVAQTIADQIGRRAFFMLGSSKHPLVAINNGLQFKVGRNRNGVSHIRIVLDASDTYTITFQNVRMNRAEMVKTVSEVEGVYFDQLHVAISAGTGLATSL